MSSEQGRPASGSLIERMEAVASRLERIAVERRSQTELLEFRGTVPVLLDDGTLKVHSWYPPRSSFWHGPDDNCSTMTIDEWRDYQANPIAIG